MHPAFLQSEPPTIYEKIGALSNEFSDEKQSSTFVFELTILAGLLLLLAGSYWIVSRRIQRRILVRQGDVDGGKAGSFEFEFASLNQTKPALLFFQDEGRRRVASGSINGENGGVVEFNLVEGSIEPGPSRMVALHESGAGRAFRVNASRGVERTVLLKSFGPRPVETFGESRRMETNLKIRVSGIGIEDFDASIVDLSRSGSGFVAEQPIPAKGVVCLTLALPSRSEPFEVEAKIVWSNDHVGGLFRAGCVFCDATFEFKAHLHDFLSELALVPTLEATNA